MIRATFTARVSADSKTSQTHMSGNNATAGIRVPDREQLLHTSAEQKERAEILTGIMKLDYTRMNCWYETGSRFSVQFAEHTAVSPQAETRLASLAHSHSILCCDSC